MPRWMIYSTAWPIVDDLNLLHPPTTSGALPPMADIRELVTSTLDDLGFGDAKPLGQRLLHRDRFFVGVRFEFEGISAIWLTDTDYLRIIDGPASF